MIMDFRNGATILIQQSFEFYISPLHVRWHYIIDCFAFFPSVIRERLRKYLRKWS
jgi:hypothetical protein